MKNEHETISDAAYLSGLDPTPDAGKRQPLLIETDVFLDAATKLPLKADRLPMPPLTGWFTDAQPKLVGVYKTRLVMEDAGDGDLMFEHGYSWWDGKHFGMQCASPSVAEALGIADAEQAIVVSRDWRGLSEEHPDHQL